jgi:hypothetical protein
MLYNQLVQADFIEIDGRYFVPESIHPNNGLEGTAYSLGSEATYDYSISVEDLNSATLKDGFWCTTYVYNGERMNVKIQCFSKQLLTGEPL